MNPGTLLPPADFQEVLSRTPSMSTQSGDDWVIKPKSLDDPVEIDPQLRSIVEAQGWENWVSRGWKGMWSWMQRDGENKVDEKEVWADQGDGV